MTRFELVPFVLETKMLPLHHIPINNKHKGTSRPHINAADIKACYYLKFSSKYSLNNFVL